MLSQIKRAIANSACHPAIGSLLSSMFSNRIPANGMRVDTANPLIAPSIKAMMFWGLYERAETRFIRQYLRNNLDVIELGASLGMISCEIRKILLSGRRLICVEANPSLIPILTNNLSLNRLDTNVLIMNKAIDYDSSNRRTVSFSNGVDTLSGHVSNGANHASFKVGTTRLSDLVSTNGVETFALVSDIEGVCV